LLVLVATAAFVGCGVSDKDIGGDEVLGEAQEASTVTRSGNAFSYKGGPFKFIGVNLRGIAHHPTGDIDAQLSAAWGMGAKVVRVFIADNQKNTTQVGDALQTLLARAALVSPDLKVIVSLTDFYGASIYILPNARMSVQNDDAFYSVGGHLSSAWFTSGYATNYKPYVVALVTRFKTDDRIFAWELGNELSAEPAGGASGRVDMLNFAYTMGWAIRNTGATQMVTTGFIDVNHAINGGVNSSALQQMYVGPWSNWASSPFHFGSIHAYNDQQWPGSSSAQDQDIAWFISHGYPYVVGEGGFTGSLHGANTAQSCGAMGLPLFTGGTWDGVAIPNATSDRGPATSATINRFFGAKSAAGYMPWGFSAGGNNIGEGDGCVGMDPALHDDWNSLWTVYNQTAAGLPAGGAAGGSKSSSTSGGGNAGCDNGVPIGGTACASQGAVVQYRCGAGSTPGNSQWTQESCNGGTCQGSACVAAPPPPPSGGCDNGVPIGGTACAAQGQSVQYRCGPGSTPGNNHWTSESCSGGTCQGNACK
jgi:Cellulase (glycosyl hydrolase family 5)